LKRENVQWNYSLNYIKENNKMRKFANFLWIDKEGENYTIRMTPELQDDVGTIGFVQFNMDDQLEAEDEILSLEASKTVMSIVTPLAGKVVARNLAATENPKLLNSEKPEEHWLVTLTDVDETAFLALEDE